jgi:hypothetical protein
MNLLITQSNQKYALLKDEATKTYHIKRLKDNKIALLGDRDDAEWFILYGIEANKEDLKTLKFK